MQPSYTSTKTAAFELKGSMITLTVLHLLNPDLNLFVADLRKHAQKTPNLFKNMPLIIDLQRINQASLPVDFVSVQHHLREHGLIPVGVRHGNTIQNSAAQLAGLALLSNQNTSLVSKPKTKLASEKPETIPTTLFIDKPIRSGQQVYARNSSLVILAPVSHGAEILADGYIHVYGCLRGRALAGVTGDKTARIFAQQLEAELISIAGYYKLQDDIPKTESPLVQVYLENDKLCIQGT
jgi:septum site-determining protein MinC